MSSPAGDVARLAAALADPTRMSMCLSLTDGRAQTCGELAQGAGVALSTASEHLSRLVRSGVLVEERQGRHRYLRLADEQIAHILEEMSTRCEPVPPPDGSLRAVRADRDLRFARSCYDHLAGRLGVAVFEAMVGRGLLDESPQLMLSDAGREWVASLGEPSAVEARSRRPEARACLDWTERRHHLAGSSGAVMLRGWLSKGWLVRRTGQRSLRLSKDGSVGLHRTLGLDISIFRYPPLADPPGS